MPCSWEGNSGSGSGTGHESQTSVVYTGLHSSKGHDTLYPYLSTERRRYSSIFYFTPSNQQMAAVA